MERSDTFHRLAAELDARGIGRADTMPNGFAGAVAGALGVSRDRLKELKRYLKKAGGDPDLAHTLRNRRNREATKASRRARYASDPEHRAAVLDAERDRRRHDFPYHVFKATRGNARTRGLPFELTREQVEEMLAPMTCSVTGLPLRPEREGPGRNPWWPSLDQAEPRGGYIEGNVRVVCWAYNVMRGELADGEVLGFARALVRGRVEPDPENGLRLLGQRAAVGHGTAKAAYMNRWKRSALKRDLDFAVSYDWLGERLSCGVCEVTGIALCFDRHASASRNPRVPSLDRIDVGRGYVEENLRLVCGWYNYARQGWPDALVRGVASAIIR